MNYKEMMVKQAKSQGKLSLHSYAIGVITSIVECSYNADEKVSDISLAIEGMDEAWDDKSLPWDYEDVKKALPQTEPTKEINHLDCTIDLAKVESFVSFPIIPLGPLCEACDCFKCKLLHHCVIKGPTSLVNCVYQCNGRISRNVCLYVRKKGIC